MNIKRIVFFMFLVTLILILISCSTEADGNTDSDNEAVKGKTLNVGFSNQPPTLDIPQTTATAAREIAHLIYEPLVTLNSALQVEPMLAETYELSEDRKTITFNLRKGIKFHNGKEMTAADVVSSMERWQELSSTAKNYLEGTEYEAVDDHTVLAHINKPSTIDMYIFADLSQFAAIMPKEIIEDLDSGGMVQEYIGTGPYTFEEWKQDQHIYLSKFEDFQSRNEPGDGLAGEKKALSEEIYFHFAGDAQTRIAGLQTGDYDIIDAVPVDDAEILKDNPDIKNAVYNTAMSVIMFNNKVGFFSDVKARQAVNAAFNVEDMLIASDTSDDYYTMDHALVSEEQTDWYTDAGNEEYNTFDPDLAKELLDEAGYDGEEIVILAYRERVHNYNTAVVIEQQLKDVGVNAVIDVRDAPTALELTEDENAWNIWVDRFAFRPVPIQQLFLDPGYMGWPDSKKLQSLSEDILYADSLEEAQLISPEFHQTFWEELPAIKVGNTPNVLAMQENLNGLQFVAGPIFWNISIDK